MTRDELIEDLAAVIAGLQVPVSMSMPLGVADAPLRRIMNEGFGWRTAEDYSAWLRETLDAVQ